MEGGEIVRHKDGSPTGILKDNAMNQLLDKIPPMTQDQKTKYFKAAMNYFLANGVTSVHDVDSIECYNVAKRLADKGELATRVYAIHPLYRWKELAAIEDRNDNKWLKRGGLKGFVDGSLGS